MQQSHTWRQLPFSLAAEPAQLLLPAGCTDVLPGVRLLLLSCCWLLRLPSVSPCHGGLAASSCAFVLCWLGTCCCCCCRDAGGCAVTACDGVPLRSASAATGLSEAGGIILLAFGGQVVGNRQVGTWKQSMQLVCSITFTSSHMLHSPTHIGFTTSGLVNCAVGGTGRQCGASAAGRC